MLQILRLQAKYDFEYPRLNLSTNTSTKQFFSNREQDEYVTITAVTQKAIDAT